MEELENKLKGKEEDSLKQETYFKEEETDVEFKMQRRKNRKVYLEKGRCCKLKKKWVNKEKTAYQKSSDLLKVRYRKQRKVNTEKKVAIA